MPTADGQLTSAELAQIAALVQAQAQMRATLTGIAVAAATGPLRGFSAFWDAAAIDGYISTALKVIRPAQLRMARTTDAYLARVMSIMTGRRIEPAGVIDVAGLRRAVTDAQAKTITDNLPAGYDFQSSQPHDTATRTNTAIAADIRRDPPPAAVATAQSVPAEQVYGRIFDAARYRITAQAHTLDQARAYATNRASHVAATDVMLADRGQSRQTMRARGVQRYRRVIRPYAGNGGPVCGLCIVAADRTYNIADLLPIHDDCRCEVVPVGAANDPGRTLNDDDLATLYAAAGGTAGRKLKTVRVVISEHGELGPLLSYGTHLRRTVTEVAAAVSPDRHVTANAQLASYESQIQRLRDRDAAGEDVSKSLTWMTNKIDELRAELGVGA